MSDAKDSRAYRRWTRKHQKLALSQGWNLFDYDGNGFLQLQRSDEANIFATDLEAELHVLKEAAKGCKTAKLALELDTYFVTRIYAREAA